MKLKIAILAMCLLAIPALADTNVNITVNTDEDTNLWTNLNVGGNVNWWLNGYSGIVPVVNNNNYGLDLGQIKDAIDIILEISDIKVGDKPGEFTLGEVYRIFPGLNLIDQLARIFVTRVEYNDLNLRVSALEKTVNATVYCNAKIEVMKEYNLTSVMCGNVTYINGGDIFGFEQMG